MGATILVVDDNESARSMIRGILETSGLELDVREARDGAEALPVALSGDVDIVLSDIVMPQLDGIGLLRSIRAKRDSNSLPIILLTSVDDTQVRQLSFESGVNDYVYKPFSPAELLSRVQVQLRMKGLQEELRKADDRHRRLGTHDELTGLANRRHVLEQCRRELARSRRHRFAMSIVALDIDGFRKVNDKLGYLAGDAIIAEVGQVLERNLRTPDVLARVAGARFLALLPQTEAHQASMVCERLRAAAQGHGFVGLGHGALMLSLGLATYPLGRLESVDELVNAAEASLDRAKVAGGNRVDVWTEETPS